MDTITAREFLVNTLNLEIFSEDEINTLCTAMNLFAKGKCREQRFICADVFMKMDQNNPFSFTGEKIITAPEPEFK